MKRIAAALLILTMLLVTACSGQKQTPPQQTPGQNQTQEPSPGTTKPNTLKLTGDVDTTKTLTTFVNIEPPPAFHGNPYDDVAGLNWSVQPLLFVPLADYSPLPNREFRPAALESFKAEGNTLTMKLRSDLKWSDGSPLTVDDVMTMFYLGAAKTTIWQVAESIEKVDDSTIVVKFVNESPLNLNLVLPSFIMTPQKHYGELAADLKTYIEQYRVFDEATGRYKFDPAGQAMIDDINKRLSEYKPDPLKDVLFSGPYILTGVTSAEAVFEANPHYYMDVQIPKVRALRSAGGESFATAVLQEAFTVENGGLSPEMTKQVEQKFKNTLRTIYVPEFSQIGYLFNYQMYPFDNPVVRKAFAYLLDRETLITLAEPGSFISDPHASGMLPSLIPAYTNAGFVDTLPDYSYNPAKAEELLTSIGWKKVNGKWANEKGEVVKIEISTIGSWPSLMYPSEAYATMLKEQGFEVEFKPMEFAAMVDYMNKAQHQIACYFVPSMSTYAHPWEVYNAAYLGAYATRMNMPQLEPGQDRILVAPSTGKEYNVTKILADLYEATDEAEIKQLTQELMTLTSDLVPFVGLIEKTAPFRIYDTKLSLAEGELGVPQNSFFWYGNLNTMLAKQLRAGELYFVK